MDLSSTKKEKSEPTESEPTAKICRTLRDFAIWSDFL